MSNQFITEILTCSIISGIVVSVISIIPIMLFTKYIKDKLPELTGTIWELKRSVDDLSFDIDRISVDINKCNTDVKDLQLSFDSLATEYNTFNTNKNQHMPSPDEVDQIEKTINDLLQTEILLSKNLKIAYKDSLERIAHDTIKTYPGVSEEYILRKATAIVESFVLE